jgi:hypothetical protein
MPDIHSTNLSDIQQQIHICRIQLYKLWSEKGHFDSEMLVLSMELDQLLNHYYQLRPAKG